MTHPFWLLMAFSLCTIPFRVSADITILPVGDSITSGFQGQPSYREELVSRLDESGCSPVTRGSQPNSTNPWPHEGYSGHRADHFINGFAANPGIDVTLGLYSAPADPVDVVLVHIGTNDMIWQQSVSSTLTEIDDIIDSIKQNSPSSKIYLANGVPLYIDEDTTGNNRLNSGTDSDNDGFFDVPDNFADDLASGIENAYANDPDVIVVDVRTGFRPTDMVSDGIHPSEDDSSDPRSDSGEHHIAVVFAAALEAEGDCVPTTNDDSFPLTHILKPATNKTVTGNVVISGRAVDTGSAGFDRVRLAILPGKTQDYNLVTNGNGRLVCTNCVWWDFSNEQFGSGFDSLNAYLIPSQTSTNFTNWRAGNPGDSGQSAINLPTGDYTVFALAVDNDNNFNYFGNEFWPERTEFSVISGGPVTPTPEVNLVYSCLAGNGRFDVNVVNNETPLSTYTFNLQGQSPRNRTVSFGNWGRMPITGRPSGSYSVEVLRDGTSILSDTVQINCGATTPPVSSPEVTLVNSCVGGNGFVLFQMVNPTSASRPYVIEFDGVPNRSTTAAGFGQAVRGTSGRPDGVYSYLVRTGGTVLDTGQVEVDCD